MEFKVAGDLAQVAILTFDKGIVMTRLSGPGRVLLQTLERVAPGPRGGPRS